MLKASRLIPAVAVAIVLVSALSAPSLGATKVTLRSLDYGDQGARYIHLDWSRTGDMFFDNYEVFMKTQNSDWTDIVRIHNPDTSDYNVTGLVPSTKYWFKIRDCDIADCQDSDPQEVMTAPLDPVYLSDVVDKDVGSSSITLRWYVDPTNPHIREYHIIEKNDTMSQEPRISTDSKYTVKGLEPDTTYCFWVLAENSFGEFSDPSNEVCRATKTADEGDKDAYLLWVIAILVIIIVFMLLFVLFKRK